MNDGRINRRTAKSDQDQADKQKGIAKRQQHQNRTNGDEKLSQTNHILIVQLHGNETADKTSDGNTNVKQAGPACGTLCINTAEQRTITCSPHASSRFHCTVTEKADQREKQEDRQEKITEEKKTVSVKKKHRNSEQNLGNYMLFAAMPLKVIKNQEFCMDFCIFPEKDWETGAKMLSFKSQESIRDLKPVQMALPTKAVLHILYKEEEIFHKDIELEAERENVFCTFPVTVTDTRDRRFHMIKAVFEIEEQNIEIPLYLMPNP